MVFRLILLGAFAVVFANVALAEDEDLTSSVYLVFDAETGDFVEVDDPDRVQQTHDAKDPAADALEQDEPSGSPPFLVLAIFAALLVVTGAAYIFGLKRRRSQ